MPKEPPCRNSCTVTQFGLSDQATQHADGDRATPPEQRRSAHHQGPVRRDRVVRPRIGDEDRPRTIGHQHGEKQRATHHQRHHEECRDPGQQHGNPHSAETDLTEPQPIDVTVHQTRAHGHQHDEAQAEEHQPTGAPGQGREFVGRTCAHVTLRSLGGALWRPTLRRSASCRRVTDVQNSTLGSVDEIETNWHRTFSRAHDGTARC